MQATITALTEQHAELDALLQRLDDAGWRLPTRCVGWTVADVVLHLAQTDEMALGSAQGRFAEQVEVLTRGLEPPTDVDAGAAAMVARERGVPPDALLERWRTSAAALRDVLAAADPHARVDWVVGQLSIRTLATTRLAECWIHTGDVAGAMGELQEPTDREEHIARLAWRTLPYAFARDGRELAGPVAFDLRAPSGARWHLRARRGARDRDRGPRARTVPGRGPACDAGRDVPHRYRARCRLGPRAGADVRLTTTPRIRGALAFGDGTQGVPR